jgi:hypothetical protein
MLQTMLEKQILPYHDLIVNLDLIVIETLSRMIEALWVRSDLYPT